MNLGFAKRARKITSLIIVSSIIGLSLPSFLPWISETKSDLEGGTQVLNIEMMKKSDNVQIKSLAEKLQLISICFWLIVIFGLLSFVGIIVYISGKFPSLGQIIMLVGCTNIVFSVLVVFLHLDMILSVGTMSGISLSFMVDFIPISYAPFPLIMGVISLIGSVWYMGIVAPFTIKHIMTLVKQKKPVETEEMESEPLAIPVPPVVEKEQPVVEDVPTGVITEKTDAEIKQWLREQMQHEEKTTAPEEPVSAEPLVDKEEPPSVEHEEQEIPLAPEPSPQEKPSDAVEETSEKPAEEEQPSKSKTPSETPEEQVMEPKGEPPTSPSFEQALSSAVEKRKPELEKTKVEEERQPAAKEISIRCPECENTFSVKMGEDLSKVECPKCGKKGITK